MRNFLIIAGFTLPLTVPACVNSQVEEATHQTQQMPVLLTPDLFVGHTLSLISNKRIECYQFGTNGLVLPTFGSKQIIVSPVYDWKIVDGHSLVMTATPEREPTARVSYEFSSFTDTLAVTTDGKKFKITSD
jgi:hypothetical protein